MKITVLGSGSAFSDLKRFNSAYLVEIDNSCFMIDCGSDALRALQRAEVNLFSIEDVYVTHMHADHCAGLPAVLTAMHVLGRKDSIRVHVPSAQIEFVKIWFANLFIFDERWSFRIEVLPLNPGKDKRSGNAELEFIPTNHLARYAEFARRSGIEPMSFSVIVHENDKSFFFSSDLDSIDDIDPRLGNSLSFVEATHPELEEISKISKRARGNIFFTHIPQELETGGVWRDQLDKRFGIKEINDVHDGQVFTI